jgi:hypothetical protein
MAAQLFCALLHSLVNAKITRVVSSKCGRRGGQLAAACATAAKSSASEIVAAMPSSLDDAKNRLHGVSYSSA